jgi:hypothetical protein
MSLRLVDKAGGWRSLTSGFIIFSFLALAGLLAISGHGVHEFLAVAYLLVAAFVMTRIMPKESGKENPFDPGAGFHPGEAPDDGPSGCDCCGRSSSGDRNNQ